MLVELKELKDRWIKQNPATIDYKTFSDPIHLDDPLNLKKPSEWEASFRSGVADYALAKYKWQFWK